MDDYQIIRKVDRLEDKATACDAHKIQCDADMDAHGKMLLQADYRTTNVEKSVERLMTSVEKYMVTNDKAVGDANDEIRKLKDFQLKLNTTWKTTAFISAAVGALIGFIIKLLWEKH